MAAADSRSSSQPLSTGSLDLRQSDTLAFLSDVHLQAAEPATFEAWAAYVSQLQADALFILGDLFEVWVGDDVLGDPQASFERECLSLIHAVSQRMPVYWMAGNRDFLLGSAACATAGMQALPDPCVLHTSQEVCLLSHGDAWCLGDTDYMKFRQTVRSAEWQNGFLAKPLQERIQEARDMRAHSESRKATQTVWADVDDQAAIDALTRHQATVLVHGHTHRPADHSLSPGLMRHVLSDWDAAASPPRLQAFTWQAGVGFKRTSLTDRV